MSEPESEEIHRRLKGHDEEIGKLRHKVANVEQTQAVTAETHRFMSLMIEQNRADLAKHEIDIRGGENSPGLKMLVAGLEQSASDMRVSKDRLWRVVGGIIVALAGGVIGHFLR